MDGVHCVQEQMNQWASLSLVIILLVFGEEYSSSLFLYRRIYGRSNELQWQIQYIQQDTLISIVRKRAFTITIYSLWRERNRRIFYFFFWQNGYY